MNDLQNFSSIHELVNSLDKIKNKSYLTHNIHPYAAKFIPQIPGCIIENYSKKGDSILDPFCGSGTSLLESIIRERFAFGIDVNPIALLTAKVKTSILKKESIKPILLVERALIKISFRLKSDPNLINLTVLKKDIPQFLNRDHWFQKNMLMELALIKDCIEKNANFESSKNFLRLCLSAIIVKASNQESETRWKGIQKNLPNGFAIRSFLKTLRENLKKIIQLEEFLNGKAISVKIKKLPISNLSSFLPKASIDLVVTSPPYLNSFDYYLYHKLRMFWLGYNHKEAQEEEIGSRNKHCDQNEGVETFTRNMQIGLTGISHVLKKRGKCIFVVGDSILRGQFVEMFSIYKDMAQKAGLHLQDSASFEQRKYSKSFTPNFKRMHKQTHIMVFQK